LAVDGKIFIYLVFSFCLWKADDAEFIDSHFVTLKLFVDRKIS